MNKKIGKSQIHPHRKLDDNESNEKENTTQFHTLNTPEDELRALASQVAMLSSPKNPTHFVVSY